MAKPIGQTARIHVFSGICCGLDLVGGEGGLMGSVVTLMTTKAPVIDEPMLVAITARTAETI